jgi:hypothetical protein
MGWFSIDRYRNPYLRQVAAWFDRRTGEPPRLAEALPHRAGRVTRQRTIEVRPIGDARSTIDARRTIDRHFVTCAEYQRFLDDQRAHDAGAPPDHWSSAHFAEGQDHEPALGVRADDARRFAQWMSRRQGSTAIYRLPSPEEARAYPAQDDSVGATWCEVGGRLVLVGLSPDRESELQRRMRTISPLPPPRTLAFDVVRIFDLARDRDLDVDLAIVVALALAHHLVTSSAASIASAASSASAASAVERDLGLELAKALGASVCRILQRTSAGEVTLALANARARARELDLDQDRTLAIALRPILAIARSWKHGGAGNAISHGMAGDHSSYELTSAPPTTPTASTRAERDDAMQLVARAFTMVEARAPRGAAGDGAGAREAMLELFGWLRLVAARKDGSMPAWEGIRLVRERPFVEPRARLRNPESRLHAVSSGG